MDQTQPVEDATTSIVADVKPVTKKAKRKRATQDGPRQPNSWLIHVKEFRAENPTMKFKDVLRNAKLTYVPARSAPPADSVA